MYLLELTLPTLAENLALDEALLFRAEADDSEVLRLWDWPHCAVVLGAGGRLAQEIDEDACRADAVPVMRRSSGGGAVLLGSGCLCFSLILRFDRDPALSDLHASYRYILNKFQRGLANVGQDSDPVVYGAVTGSESCPTTFQGTSDLALNDRKFSGNAQQRKRSHLLHHGTLLYGFDPAPLARYLKPPPRQPEYRRGRTHADFVTNLPIEVDRLKQIIKDIWPTSGVLADWPMEMTKKLAFEKYATDEWIRRR